MTQVVNGIHLPGSDTHFASHLRSGRLFEGRGTYQLNKIEMALALCRIRRRAVDVGAHVGLWSRVLASNFLEVVAFEPVPAHVECFRSNLEGIPNVELRECALGKEAGTVLIEDVPDNTGNAHVSGRGVLVEMLRLDDLDLGRVDFIKIDVEGFELSVIDGGEGLIRDNRPVMVIEQKGAEERYGFAKREAVKRVESWGARVAWAKAGDFCLIWT